MFKSRQVRKQAFGDVAENVCLWMHAAAELRRAAVRPTIKDHEWTSMMGLIPVSTVNGPGKGLFADGE